MLRHVIFFHRFSQVLFLLTILRSSPTCVLRLFSNYIQDVIISIILHFPLAKKKSFSSALFITQWRAARDARCPGCQWRTREVPSPLRTHVVHSDGSETEVISSRKLESMFLLCEKNQVLPKKPVT